MSSSLGFAHAAKWAVFSVSLGSLVGQGGCVDDPPNVDDPTTTGNDENADDATSTTQGSHGTTTLASSSTASDIQSTEGLTSSPTSEGGSTGTETPASSEETGSESDTETTGAPFHSSSEDSGGTTGTPDTGEASTAGDIGSSSTTLSDNELPVLADDVYRLFQGSDALLAVSAAQGVLSNDNDPDGDTLRVAAATVFSDAGAEVELRSDGGFDYVPAATWWGEDVFTYSVSDGRDSVDGMVRVIVSPTDIPAEVLDNGRGGFIIDAEAESDQLGVSVAGRGDVNGDGRPDLVLGAYDAGPNAGDNAPGRGYVLFGPANQGRVRLSDVAAGQGGFAIQGETAGDHLGWSVDVVGDMNQDGRSEIVLGAWRVGANGNDDAGRAYVVFGKTDGALVRLSDVSNGIGGFAIEANPEDGSSQLGRSVAGAGDLDGDGRGDIIVGAIAAAPNGVAGRCYALFGKADGTLVELADVAQGQGGGFVINGEAEGDFAGRSVAGVGDVDGDGLDDVAIGVRNADIGDEDVGRTYVVFGKNNGVPVSLSDITDGLGGFAIDGQAPADWAGSWVSNAGDVNGDDIDDIVIGARQADRGFDMDVGRSYVVFGRQNNTQRVFLSQIAQGIGGFAIEGESADDQTGTSVAGAGDVNGDGLDDVIVGAWQRDPNNALDFGPGKAFVVYGKSSDTTPVQLSSFALRQGGGFRIRGELFGDELGSAVSGAGDLNGDGFDDIVVGAWETERNSDNERPEGRAYVVYGGDYR